MEKYESIKKRIEKVQVEAQQLSVDLKSKIHDE